MVWKTSTDMNRVLVSSEGHLDGPTGYVVCRLLQETAAEFDPKKEAILSRQIAEYEGVMRRDGKQSLTASSDLLDLGMGLWICHFFKNEPWAARLGYESLDMSHMVLDDEDGVMSGKAHRRLAFREFGTCLGIRCFGQDEVAERAAGEMIRYWEAYMETGVLGDSDLNPISLVMYAAALNPGGKSGVWYRSYGRRSADHLIAFKQGFLATT